MVFTRLWKSGVMSQKKLIFKDELNGERGLSVKKYETVDVIYENDEIYKVKKANGVVFAIEKSCIGKIFGVFVTD